MGLWRYFFYAHPYVHDVRQWIFPHNVSDPEAVVAGFQFDAAFGRNGQAVLEDIVHAGAVPPFVIGEGKVKALRGQTIGTIVPLEFDPEVVELISVHVPYHDEYIIERGRIRNVEVQLGFERTAPLVFGYGHVVLVGADGGAGGKNDRQQEGYGEETFQGMRFS